MLTAKCVERTTNPGRYRDGLVPDLLLQISESGAKSWVLRYALHGRERMMGLGGTVAFNLKEARERARSARQLLADGVDLLASKQAAKAAAKPAASKALTFREAALLVRARCAERRLPRRSGIGRYAVSGPRRMAATGARPDVAHARPRLRFWQRA